MNLLEIPYLPHTSPALKQLARIDWIAGAAFTGYGVRFGLRTNDPAAIEALRPWLPLGWEPARHGPVDALYSLQSTGGDATQSGEGTYTLFCGGRRVARADDLDAIGGRLERHATLRTALLARELLFVHAGVVAWGGRAILIPGRSMSGKTTLVRALVAAGGTYYSDEFAVLDRGGLVHPYPRPLSIRSPDRRSARRLSPDELGISPGTVPMPIGLVVVTSYRHGAVWRPRKLSPAQAMLALMDNTVAARRDPSFSMPILRQAVSNTPVLCGTRGDAANVVGSITRRMNGADEKGHRDV